MEDSVTNLSASATKRQYLLAAQQDQTERIESYRQQMINEFVAEREGFLQLQVDERQADWLVDEILHELNHDLSLPRPVTRPLRTDTSS